MEENPVDIHSQINLIKNVMFDKAPYQPFRRSSLIVWGVFSAILILGSPHVLYHFGLVAMGVFIAVFVALGIGFEIMTFIKSNKAYEMPSTSNQKFTTSFWILTSTFATLITIYASRFGHVELIYPTWIFTVGLTNFLIGHLYLNIAKIVGFVSMIASFALLVFLFFINFGDAYEISKYVALVFLSGSTILMGLYLPRDEVRV